MDESGQERIEELRRRVAAEPHNLALRFKLGVALFNCGAINPAIPELQRARHHPEHRLAALRLLAQAYASKGMGDLAIHMRRQASEEGDEPPDSAGPGSAPRPAPLHPITPRADSAAKRLPDGPERSA